MTAKRLAVALQNGAPDARVPPRASIRAWVRAALGGRRGEVTVRIVSAEESAALNGKYRKRSGATNVLSFPADADTGATGELAPVGDLVVCAAVLEREAREQGTALEAHWAHIVIHGALHLVGYDHVTARQARAMEARETEILAALGFPDPYTPPPRAARAGPLACKRRARPAR